MSITRQITNNPTISLVVPFYNEERQIQDTFQILTMYLRKHYRDRYELLFVNDGSTDSSVQVLCDLLPTNPRATLISYTHNKGRGYALSRGFRNARGSVIGYIDSDLQISEQYIARCVAELQEHDIAVISKNLSDSRVSTTPLRRIASKLFNLSARLLLGVYVSDTQGGLKMFRRNTIMTILPKITSRGWLFDLETLYWAQRKGFTIGEVPVTVRYGFGGIRFSMVIDFFSSLVLIWKLRLKNR